MPIEADHVWDLWARASQENRELSPVAFAEGFGAEAAEVLSVLEAAQDVQDRAPPPSLVHLLTGDVGPPDGKPRFAGFRLEEELGHGTSGIVFRATDLREGSSGEIIALKILNPLLSAGPERRELILREARIAGELDHPGIVTILDSGVERGYAWIAAEYVEGRPLDELIEDERPAPEREARAIDLALQMAQALEHAHARGVIHRDLKPANVLCDDEGNIRILDFGLASAEGTAFSLSSTGDAVGTPLYMAPEQARGDSSPGPPVDVFAIGLLLSELATGHRRATDANLLRVLRRRAEGNTRVPRPTLAELSPPLRSVVRRCVEGHPADRYPNCAALAQDLRDVAAGRPPRLGAMPSVVRNLRRVRRHPWRTAASLLSLGLLLTSTWYAGHTWWTWPAQVRIGTLRDGKTLWVDGEAVGTTNLTVPMAPGEHELTMQFELDAGDPNSFFRHSITVPRGAGRLERFFFFDPPRNLGRQNLCFGGLSSPEDETRFPDCVVRDAPHAWIQFTARFEPQEEEPLEEKEPTEAEEVKLIRLTIDGEVFEDQLPIGAFHMPQGAHRIRVEADGYHPFERTVLLDSYELCMLSFVMDPVDEDRHTIVLYSVADYDVCKRALVEIDGLKVICEPGQEPGNLELFVNKPYWAPLDNYGQGYALLAVKLPVSPSILDLWFCVETTAPDGWSLIEGGASPESLFPLWVVGTESPPDELTESFPAARTRTPVANVETWNGTKGEVERRLVDELRGSPTLYLRFWAGGTLAGDSNSKACALRCNGLPMVRPDGSMRWEPAAVIGVTE